MYDLKVTYEKMPTIDIKPFGHWDVGLPLNLLLNITTEQIQVIVITLGPCNGSKVGFRVDYVLYYMF